ncbi:MAG: phosphodiesterase [Hyphomicrobiales bacterium]
MLIAQLTDTHIRPPGRLAYRKVDTAAYLERAVEHLGKLPLPVDAVIFTGDLVDFGTDAEYERLAALIAPIKLPVYPIPGNHDDRDAMRRAFAHVSELPKSGDLSYAVECGQLRLVMLDSTMAGKPHGDLDSARLRWLDETLCAAPGRPVLLALHHPPFLTGIRHMDVQNCFNSEGLEAVLTRHPQVLSVVCGHIHRTIFTSFAGRSASIAPSPAHAVDLDLDPLGAPAFRLEPPGLHLHWWQPEPGPFGRIVTHLAPIGDFEGPYPFFDANGALID